MANGLYLIPDGMVLVDYGTRRIPIPRAQYKANGYKPALDILMTKSPRGSPRLTGAHKPPVRPETDSPR